MPGAGRPRVPGLGCSFPGSLCRPPDPAPASAVFPSCRKGEGAFRLQPRGPEQRPQPPDKYELRETKRRLQQGLDSSLQSPLGPGACSHLSPLRRRRLLDPFCGELARPRSPALGSLLCRPAQRRGAVRAPLTGSSLFPDYHSCLPTPMPAASQPPPGLPAPVAPEDASAPAQSPSPEAPPPPPQDAPGCAAPCPPCPPCRPRLLTPVGRLWSPLPAAGRGHGGPAPSPPDPLDSTTGLVLGPALRAAFCGARSPYPPPPSPASCPRPCWEPSPCPHPRPRP